MRLCLVACSLHADLEIYISKRLKKIKSHVLRHVTITAAPRHPRAGGCWFLAPCGRSGPTCEMPGQCESPAPRASVYPRHLWAAGDVRRRLGAGRRWSSCAVGRAVVGDTSVLTRPWWPTCVVCVSSNAAFSPISTPCGLSLQMRSPQMWRPTVYEIHILGFRDNDFLAHRRAHVCTSQLWLLSCCYGELDS